MTELPTKVDLNELEARADWAIAGRKQAEVEPHALLSLIAAARELEIAREAVDSAMERLFRRGDVNDDGDLAQVVKLLCWSKVLPSLPEPTNGR